jgi:hypothetical protein
MPSKHSKKKTDPADISDVPLNSVAFAKEQLGLELYPWQEAVIRDVGEAALPVALAAANGSGKTSMIAAPLVLWHCHTFPQSEVVTTAGVYRQVKEQLWVTIRRHAARLGKDWKTTETGLTAPNGARAIGFSTKDPYKFEGWHGGPGGNLLLIFDEAKSVPESIFEAAKRCNAKGQKRVLLMSSTGGTSGEFAAAFGRKRHLYRCHTITAYDCPHLKPEEIEALIAEYGREHPLVRSAIFSEFTDADAIQLVISPRVVAQARQQPPLPVPGRRWAYIDWAAGGDECVIAILEGNRLLPLVCWRDADTPSSVGRAARELKQAGVPHDHVFADGGGLGIPMNHYLMERGVAVTPINNGDPARHPDYQNRAAELWFKAARHLEKREVILPADEKLDFQLTSRRVAVAPNGKLGVEAKAAMLARGVRSPDRADAATAIISLALNAFDQSTLYTPAESVDVFETSPVLGINPGP